MPSEIAPSDPSHPQPSASQPRPPPPTHASPNPTSKASSSSPDSNIKSILETGRRRSEALGLASTSRLTDADVQRLAQHEGIPTDAPMDGSSSTDEHTPDERTAIVARERAARANGDGEYGATTEGTKRVRSRNSQHSLTRARSRAQSQQSQSQSRQRRGSAVPTSVNNQQTIGGEKEEPWWKKQLEKYGSLELENKGSVARDHLALGRSSLRVVGLLGIHANFAHRTHFPRMATNFPRFRIDWRSNHTALPPQHDHFTRRGHGARTHRLGDTLPQPR